MKPLYKNPYAISDTRSFIQQLSTLPPLEKDEGDVSYVVECLFTSIPVKKTIDYIIDYIHMKKKLTPIWIRLILKSLLLKFSTECNLTFSIRFYQQTDGCIMFGPLFITISDSFMVKLENGVVVPLKSKIYRRYMDDMFNRRYVDNMFNRRYMDEIYGYRRHMDGMFNRRKINEADILFWLSNHHLRIKLTIGWNS